MRSGTLNVPGIVGMGAAAAQVGVCDPAARDALEAVCVAHGGVVLGAGAPRLPNTLSVLFPFPGDLVTMALDLEGFSVSTGSACSSGSATDSHVVAAMGLSGIPVRFSLGANSDIGLLLQILPTVLERMRGACAL